MTADVVKKVVAAVLPRLVRCIDDCLGVQMKLTVISQEKSLLPTLFKGSESKIAISMGVFAMILFASPFATTQVHKHDTAAKIMHAKSKVSATLKK